MAARTKTQAPDRKSEDEILQNAMERVQREAGDDEDGAEAAPEKPAEPKPAGKRNQAASASAPELPRSKKKAVIVAYTPLEEGDPVFTIFFGMKFTANLPREVTNEEAIKLARNNPWFTVDGKHHARRVKPGAPEEDENQVRSGLPDGLDPDKHEVEATAEDFKE